MNLTVPVWSVPVALTTFLAVLGFAWRLAVRAERLTDKLEALVERMATLETRLAVVTALETQSALLAQQLSHLASRSDAQDAEIRGLRERLHQLANDLAQSRAELARVSSIPTPLPLPPRSGR